MLPSKQCQFCFLSLECLTIPHDHSLLASRCCNCGVLYTIFVHDEYGRFLRKVCEVSVKHIFAAEEGCVVRRSIRTNVFCNACAVELNELYKKNGDFSYGNSTDAKDE